MEERGSDLKKGTEISLMAVHLHLPLILLRVEMMVVVVGGIN